MDLATESIIVYQNPMQQWMWESGFAEVAATIFALGIAAIVLCGIVDGMKQKRRLY